MGGPADRLGVATRKARPQRLEAGRDLGASPWRTFWRVTVPLSKPAILAGLIIVTLPMFGDYYTNNLLSNSPRTTMIGNLIDLSYATPGRTPTSSPPKCGTCVRHCDSSRPMK